MKKIKYVKLFIATFMMLSLLVTGSLFPLSAIETADVVDGAHTISNDKVSLTIGKDGAVTLTDLATGNKYYSTPTDVNEKGKIDAASRARALSQLVLEVVDEEGKNSIITSNTAVISIKSTKKSITVKYTFNDVKINVSLVYTLKGNSFVASVPLKSIKDNKKIEQIIPSQTDVGESEKIVKSYSIIKISVLPYFDAADREDQGYILVPDGSGALITFNNGKASTPYSQKVYGTDPIVNRKTMMINTQNILLPVIGIHKEGVTASNTLMYVEEGDSAAIINANSSTNSNSYNYGYFTFVYRSSAKIKLLENTQQPVEATMIANNKASCKNFAVSFNVLSANGDYNEMADVTRAKLIADGLETDKITDKVYIEAYMSVNKTKHFLGIPYKANEVLTTFDECLKLIKKLDGNAVMILNGLDKYGSVGGTVDTDFSVNSQLGGIKKYKSFVKSAAKYNSEIFPVSEFVVFNKSKWGYTTFWDNARSVDVKPIERLYYLYGNYEENKDYPSLRYIIPTKLVKIGTSYTKSLVKNGITNAAPLSIGNTPYSSRDGKGCDIVSVADNYSEILNNMKSNGVSIALQSPAAYALNYTDYAYGMPLRSSGFTCFDTDIPFVQLVLNGVKSYSTVSLNLTNSIPVMKLLMIESASAPTYTVIGKEYKDVKDTPLDVLYGANLSSLQSSIAKEVKEYRELFAKTEGKISKHTIVTNTLRVVEFENGAKVIINYDDSVAEYEGITIDAVSYKLIEGGVSNE